MATANAIINQACGAIVVDDFGVQYTNVSAAQHLLAALKQHYEAITVDWTGSLFCAISL
jgi:2-phospho-L-lactate guanylyltransferase (CobY/MobA/RfbA family)